ncbi:putative ATP-grasp-modified RiPP [Actinopolyspora mortivallis]|uniref:putative ATP-grasp-modified RiPP n=1 Tax=Actinopolyspora mortivallis TaxID=33906 RepID=UPI00037CBF5A|nr:putative ATP-grasp-modified RiPP [Actinopolyspora mortivallis]
MTVADPLAPDSSQFPLARPSGLAENTDTASPEGVRPWGLRGMHTVPSTGRGLPSEWHYDHERQVAVDREGNSFHDLRMDPSADSVSDGDEGRVEDWMYDFAPDFPGPPA